MAWLVAKLWGFLRGPDLPREARRTYRFHLAYAVLDAAAGGILLNAPQMALRLMDAPNWQLPLREMYSGVGMLAALYLGSWMAPRRKMPFVFIPGMLCGLTMMAMALAVGEAFWFMTFLGISAMFEITVRQAVTAIVRLNYPVVQRGAATGEIRKWSSLSVLVVAFLSACALHWAGDSTVQVAQAQIVCAAVLSLASFLCFRRIRVQEDPDKLRHDLQPEVLKNFRDAVGMVVRDGRYRRYLLACFVDGFCGALYLPLIWALLSKTLEFNFVWSTVLMHSLPALVAFAATGLLGHWFDRTNPWIAWAWIRFMYGLDALLLAATPLFMPDSPPATLPLAVIMLPVLGRILRGSMQGGQFVMWWQIGVTHFAPPGEDTSRYMGMMGFLTGAIRLGASAVAIVLTALAVTPETLLVIGGLGVILAGLYSLWQAVRERKERRPQTIAEFESQFTGIEP